MKKVTSIILLAIAFIFTTTMLRAQPPAGKYNTTDYPEDRKAIGLLRTIPDSLRHLNDDYLAVGPTGEIAYGLEQWKKGILDAGFTFKSVKPVPGMSVLRIYNGDAAVSHNVMDVVLATPNGDINMKVVRMECYIKINGKWYFVQGQGTRLLSKEEIEEMTKKMINKN